jgi:hypothetical protein
MSSERDFPVELMARDDAAWNWPDRSASAMADELATLCEALARRLQESDDAAPPPRDPLVHTRLAFVYGSALLTLAERDKPALLPDAVRCLSDALSLARRHAPERVVAIKPRLLRAEHSLAQQRDATHAA